MTDNQKLAAKLSDQILEVVDAAANMPRGDVQGLAEALALQMVQRSETRAEWNHIAVYENGKRDLALTVLNLFQNQLPDEAKTWLRLEVEANGTRIEEARREAAA